MSFREYETVFITQPNLPESQYKQMLERIAALVERHDGRLFYARNMGKRTLAYPINKQIKGLYTCLDYAAKGTAVGELERAMRLNEDILRFLTVVKAEEVDVEARAAEIVAKGEDSIPPPSEDGSVVMASDEQSRDADIENTEAAEVTKASAKEEA